MPFPKAADNLIFPLDFGKLSGLDVLLHVLLASKSILFPLDSKPNPDGFVLAG